MRVFHPIWVWGGSPKGLVHNLLMQFFIQPILLKNGSFRNLFFDIAITQTDHPRYVKHVSGRIYVFFTLFGN